MKPIEIALTRWNSQQPAWKPIKTWKQLTIEEKIAVCRLECVVTDLYQHRLQEIEEVAERVSTALVMTFSIL